MTCAAQRRVVVVGYNGAELLDIACVTSTLDMAGRIARQPLYRVDVVTLAAAAGSGRFGIDHLITRRRAAADAS